MNDFLRLLWSGKQDCEPLYKVGPYPRTCYILHYVLRGRGRIQAYGQETQVGAGQMFAIWKGENLSYIADGSDPWTYVWADFDGSAADGLLALTGFTREERVCAALPGGIFRPLFENMRALNTGGRSERCAALLGLFSALINAFPAGEERGSGISARVAEAMRAGFTDSSLRIDALARAAGVSRSHLYRLFRSEYGVSPKAYLRDLRLTLARRLLCEHAMSVAEVAYACTRCPSPKSPMPAATPTLSTSPPSSSANTASPRAPSHASPRTEAADPVPAPTRGLTPSSAAYAPPAGLRPPRAFLLPPFFLLSRRFLTCFLSARKISAKRQNRGAPAGASLFSL